MPYECFTNDGNAAVILSTNLDSGDVVGVCPECISIYAVGLLQGVTGREWRPVMDDTDPATDEPDDGDEGADGPTISETPAPTVSPTVAPGSPDDGDGDDEPGPYEDQATEDNAAYLANLRVELSGRS